MLSNLGKVINQLYHNKAGLSLVAWQWDAVVGDDYSRFNSYIEYELRYEKSCFLHKLRSRSLPLFSLDRQSNPSTSKFRNFRPLWLYI